MEILFIKQQQVHTFVFTKGTMNDCHLHVLPNAPPPELEEITNDQIINQFLTLTIKCPINYFCSLLKLQAI